MVEIKEQIEQCRKCENFSLADSDIANNKIMCKGIEGHFEPELITLETQPFSCGGFEEAKVKQKGLGDFV